MVLMTVKELHSTLIKSFHVDVHGMMKNLMALLNFSCTNIPKRAKKQFGKTTVCRFGFPKYPMLQTEILEPLISQDPEEQKTNADNFARIKTVLAQIKPCDEQSTMTDFLAMLQLDYDSYISAIRSSLKTATTFIQRSPSELRVNNYTVHCLRAWQANHDIQFILDVYIYIRLCIIHHNIHC